jgi:hypothetical protein
MTFTIRYHCGETEVDGLQLAETIEQARSLIAAKAADLKQKADLAIIFRVSPSGTEELEEVRKLHA